MCSGISVFGVVVDERLDQNAISNIVKEKMLKTKKLSQSMGISFDRAATITQEELINSVSSVNEPLRSQLLLKIKTEQLLLISDSKSLVDLHSELELSREAEITQDLVKDNNFWVIGSWVSIILVSLFFLILAVK